MKQECPLCNTTTEHRQIGNGRYRCLDCRTIYTIIGNMAFVENHGKVRRLQGSMWHKFKEKLRLLNHSKPTSNGNIRGLYVNSRGKRFCHWLNDAELKEVHDGKK